MKNTIKIIGIIALVAIAGLWFGSCEADPEDQTVIIITGLDNDISNYAAVVVRKDASDESDMKGMSLPKPVKSNGRVELRLIDEKEKTVAIDGSYYVWLAISTNESMSGTPSYAGRTDAKVSLVKGENTIKIDRFFPAY